MGVGGRKVGVGGRRVGAKGRHTRGDFLPTCRMQLE